MLHPETRQPTPDRLSQRVGTSSPAPLRRELEPAFKHDFADVRIHTDAQAAQETRLLGAISSRSAAWVGSSTAAARRCTTPCASASTSTRRRWLAQRRIAASSSHSGVLDVTATMNDPDTASTVTYTDAVVCELVPCA